MPILSRKHHYERVRNRFKERLQSEGGMLVRNAEHAWYIL